MTYAAAVLDWKASRAYLDQHGTPATVDGLRGHRTLNFTCTRSGKPFPFELIEQGVIRRLQLKGSVTSADAYHACCAASLGLIQAPRCHLNARIRDGSLVKT